jgi:hypothetical protein
MCDFCTGCFTGEYPLPAHPAEGEGEELSHVLLHHLDQR